MIFNSLEFLVFFPIVVALVRFTPVRSRWAVLLIASYVFYMAWNPWYIGLIIASTVTDYIAGIRIGAATSTFVRRCWLAASLSVNLGLLFAFKYAGFFAQTAEDLAAMLGMEYAAPAFELLLPVGISFYTFQTLSYTIDVFRGHQEPVRHFGRFALYVAFFPQLVAGPIERPGHLLPQLQSDFRWDAERAREGLALMLWGMFKKVVVADRLGVYVDVIFESPERFTGPYAVFGAVCFAFQIYADFSGYSDIAIGAARILGVDLMRNFNRPYIAQSVREFWQRWHISLSTWFRDYVYVSLGGNRVGLVRWAFAIAAVFLLSGLWHGANWTFVVWGAIHGAVYLWERFFYRTYSDEDSPILVRIVKTTFNFGVVCAAWVFFRAESMGAAVDYFVAMTHGWLSPAYYQLDWITGERTAGGLGILYAFGLMLYVYIAECVCRDGDVPGAALRARMPVRWTWYLATALAILNLGTLNERPFIYFQF